MALPGLCETPAWLQVFSLTLELSILPGSNNRCVHSSLSLMPRTKISSLLMDEKQQQQLTTLLLDTVISELLSTLLCPLPSQCFLDLVTSEKTGRWCLICFQNIAQVLGKSSTKFEKEWEVNYKEPHNGGTILYQVRGS